MTWVRSLSELTKNDISLAGGKGASLGELLQQGLNVPPGFVVLASAFDSFVQPTQESLGKEGESIQERILRIDLPSEICNEISIAFRALGVSSVAVRSSATAEDGKVAAWAGQLDTFLHTDEDHLLLNIKRCWASLFSERAIAYRKEQGQESMDISVAVVVQVMIESDISGIAFSVHPVTQDTNQLIVEAASGLGEAIVSGQVTPDTFVVEKSSLRILERELNAGSSLSDAQLQEVAKQVIMIEKSAGFPVDVEWAIQGDRLSILQSRPITTLSLS